MLMLCWFYCVPFVKMLYYASGLLLVLFGAFALKRGIVRARPGLRQAGFFLFFIAAAKLLVFDLRDIDQLLPCASAGKGFFCAGAFFKAVGFLGILTFCGVSAALLHFYRLTLYNKRPQLRPPEETRIRLWANGAMTVVILLIVWAMAPWVGSLTVGGVPAMFRWVPWQALSLLSVVVLLGAFWKAENCDWGADRRGRRQIAMGIRPGSMAAAGWTPRDTLWTAVFLYLAAVALAYVSADVLG